MEQQIILVEGKLCVLHKGKPIVVDMPCPNCKVSPGDIKMYKFALKLLSGYIEYITPAINQLKKEGTEIQNFSEYNVENV